MAKQNIGIGSAANDGTGDPLRTAFDKANDNFTELYNHVASTSNPHSVTKTQIGLGNAVNSLQVINAGGFVSLMADTLGNRPAASLAGRYFYATDFNRLYRDTGSAWVAITLIPVVNQDSNYVADQDDYYVGITTVPHTLTLPASAGTPNGFPIIVKDESGGAAGNNITVTPDGSDTIDGQASFPIVDNYGCLHIMKRGTNWNVINYYAPVET